MTDVLLVAAGAFGSVFVMTGFAVLMGLFLARQSRD